MIIKFPIDNDRDFNLIISILEPSLFNIMYATPEGREAYYSLTERQRRDIATVIKYHYLED